MKTQGIQIEGGLLVIPYLKAVPPAFWSRLKHEIVKAGLSGEFKADMDVEAKAGGLPWEREERLFRRWVERLGLRGPLWPWERGWNPALVDAYLTREPPRIHWQEKAEEHDDG